MNKAQATAHLSAMSSEDKASLIGMPWMTVVALLIKYGPAVFAIIQADLAAGKNIFQVIQDLLGVVNPGPGPETVN